jgi:hypothetical protein
MRVGDTIKMKRHKDLRKIYRGQTAVIKKIQESDAEETGGAILTVEFGLPITFEGVHTLVYRSDVSGIIKKGV